LPPEGGKHAKESLLTFRAPTSGGGKGTMRIVHQRCCALDVHKTSITACILVWDGEEAIEERKKEFGTTKKELERLRFWLMSSRVTIVAMESAGVYWKPVWHVLERQKKFQLKLVNAQQYHGVDGQKTDQIDASWLAELLQCGLLKGSFVPPQWQRELRDLTRLRVSLIEEQNRVQNRIEKLLEDANIKLGSVASDTLGVSGRKILNAVVEGKRDPGWMADYAKGRLRARRQELEEALHGFVTDHHRRLLAMMLRQIDNLDADIASIESDIRGRLEPHQDVIGRLIEIPGFGEVSVWTIIAELGLDMKVFGDQPERAASWCGLCPGNRKSAGKRGHGRTRKGNRWIRRGLTQTAIAASNKKDTYLRSFYWRIASKRGPKKARIATAHKQLKIAFLIIRDGIRYRDLGPDHFDQRNADRTKRYLVKRLQTLGLKVTLEPAA
jgi:transposase